MKREWKEILVTVMFAAALICGCSARAARLPRIELLRAASVSGTRVFLSDLLPVTAPESLRALAAEISLGAAPQPGNARVLERDAVERDARVRQEVLSEVSVPDRMIVSRDGRAVTASEVFTAIRMALKQNGVVSARPLRPDDIVLESQIMVRPGDAGLEVMRMDLDRGLQRARFLLWPSRDPQVLPFYVTARLEMPLPLTPIPLAAQVIGYARESAISERMQSRQGPAKQDILVAQGEHATLTLQSAAVRIFVDVVSLEKGTLGQRIRVRLLDSEKVFTARVDGRSRLEAAF